MKKRGLLVLLVLGVLLGMLGTSCTPAPAEEGPYPNKAITVVAPYGAGGGTDRASRMMAGVWGSYSDVPLRVIDMPGAGSAEGTKFVAESDPDGYTLLNNASQMVTLPYFYSEEEIGWTLKDFEPVCMQQIIAYMLVVPKDSPFNTLNDMIEYGKANPGDLTYGAVGFGGDSHVAFRALEMVAGFEATIVPFDGGAEQVANIAGGHIDTAVATFGTMLPLAESGDAKVLAVGTAERNPVLPDVPTAIEQGIDWTFLNWRGYHLPLDVPQDRLDYIATTMEQCLSDVSLTKLIEKGGEEPRYLGPAEYAAFLENADGVLGPSIQSILAEQ